MVLCCVCMATVLCLHGMKPWQVLLYTVHYIQTATLCMQGHSDTVEDVVFQPGSSNELASVADDSSLLFWDTRSGIAPVLRMAEAHGESDLHVVDWSSLRPELLATGTQAVYDGYHGFRSQLLHGC